MQGHNQRKSLNVHIWLHSQIAGTRVSTIIRVLVWPIYGHSVESDKDTLKRGLMETNTVKRGHITIE